MVCVSGLPLRPNCRVHFAKGPVISSLTNAQLLWVPGKHWYLVKPSRVPHGHYFFLKAHIFSDSSAEGIFFFSAMSFMLGGHCRVYVAWDLILLKERLSWRLEGDVSWCLQC